MTHPHIIKSDSGIPPVITIKHHDLTPDIQTIVKEIRKARKWRGAGDVTLLTGLGFAIAEYLNGRTNEHAKNILISSAGLIIRQRHVKQVQAAHKEIAKKMRKKPAISEHRAGWYPPILVDTQLLIRNRPVFVVKPNGDIQLRSEDGEEFSRYRKQQGMQGEWGLNTWRWRGYLRPLEPYSGKRVKTLLHTLLQRYRTRAPTPAHAAVRHPRSSARRPRRK